MEIDLELYMHAIAAGSGPPLILVHGMAASLHDWEAMTPILLAAGYRVHALDLPGHGQSHKPASRQAYHASYLAERFAEWVESLGLSAPPVLIGHSLGGYLCLDYALRFPAQTGSLVLIDPFYSRSQLTPLLRLLHHRPSLGEKAMHLAPGWLLDAALRFSPSRREPTHPRARQQIKTDYKRASPSIVFIPRTLRDLSPQLHQVMAETLVIWGAKDATLLPASFPRLVQALPKALGHALAGIGHQPHIVQPELVARLTLQFLAQRERSATLVDGPIPSR